MADTELGEVSPAFSAAVLAECLDAFPHVRLTVTGECMRPALHPGEIVLLARPALRPPRFGDVVLFQHREGLRLHRLVWGPPLAAWSWRTKGDLSRSCDPRISPRDVLGTVIAVEGRSRMGGHVGPALRSLARLLVDRLWHALGAGRPAPA